METIEQKPTRPIQAGIAAWEGRAYARCEQLSAGLILFMIVFSPWAFGTTERWSIWTMNLSGYLLGGLLLAKGGVRWVTGYRPLRWDSPDAHSEWVDTAPPVKRDWWTLNLAVLTFGILAFTLVSAMNARAVYVPGQRRFLYQECIRWLPHSYDYHATWQMFWMYAALACFFWAVRDWLLGDGSSARTLSRPGRKFPDRLRLLLWVLCINGAILALEGILQRASGTDKLLGLSEAWFNKEAMAQFGPYAYRGSAASYFNLLWPVCLGFWLVMRRCPERVPPSRRLYRTTQNRRILLLALILTAACPVLSTSRGGALVELTGVLIAMPLVFWHGRQESVWFRVGGASLFAAVIGVWLLLGWSDLAVRFKTILADRVGRTEIYANALVMARDFAWFGSGPGSFGSLYQLYRTAPGQEWAGYVHNDWLETRITFGWLGLGMVLVKVGLAVMHPVGRRGWPVRWEFIWLIWLAMAGSLAHALVDFPFQVYSIVLLFVLLASILCAVTGRSMSR